MKKVIITVKHSIEGDTSFRVKVTENGNMHTNRNLGLDSIIATHVLTDDSIKELPFKCYIPLNNISSINIFDDGE